MMDPKGIKNTFMAFKNFKLTFVKIFIKYFFMPQIANGPKAEVDLKLNLPDITPPNLL